MNYKVGDWLYWSGPVQVIEVGVLITLKFSSGQTGKYFEDTVNRYTRRLTSVEKLELL